MYVEEEVSNLKWQQDFMDKNVMELRNEIMEIKIEMQGYQLS